jgi:hypothetical protein
MTYELTSSEKASIIESHLKNLENNKYNLELSLIEENSVASPNQTIVDSIQGQLSALDQKKTALLAELADITE